MPNHPLHPAPDATTAAGASAGPATPDRAGAAAAPGGAGQAPAVGSVGAAPPAPAATSCWPDPAEPLASLPASSVITGFDPARGEGARRRAQVAARLALCRPGLTLRVLLGVQVVVALAVLPSTAGPADALRQLAGPATAALGGSLLWLAAVCGLRERLAQAGPAAARRGVLGLGGLAGAVGWALLLPLGLATPGGWPAAAAVLAGGALAQAAWAWLGLRSAAARPVEADARLAELQSRIRPHFLFNALNTALVLVQVDPRRAEAVLEDLSALFRAALAETGAAVSLDDELELAQRYLAIEKIRFADRLALQWDLDPAAAAAALPPLVLQPLVENAVRHGVEPAARGGSVLVRTRVARGMAEVEVVNTLPEAPGPAGSGIALANVRERLRLLHDLAAELHTWQADGLHHARIRVPL